MNWPIRRAIRTSAPPPQTLAEYMAKKRQASERRQKRSERAQDLWGHQTPRIGRARRLTQPRTAGAGLNETGPTRKTVEKQLDHLCKLIAFRRDRRIYAGFCLVCVVKRELGYKTESPLPITTPYHVVPRGDKAVRWDTRNVIGSCSPCNLGEKMSRNKAGLRERYRAIHAVIVGDEVLKELESLALTTTHNTTADLIEMRNKLKSQLENRHGNV